MFTEIPVVIACSFHVIKCCQRGAGGIDLPSEEAGRQHSQCAACATYWPEPGSHTRRQRGAQVRTTVPPTLKDRGDWEMTPANGPLDAVPRPVFLSRETIAEEAARGLPLPGEGPSGLGGLADLVMQGEDPLRPIPVPLAMWHLQIRSRPGCDQLRTPHKRPLGAGLLRALPRGWKHRT